MVTTAAYSLLCGVISGFGFTVTVTVKVAPGQFQYRQFWSDGVGQGCRCIAAIVYCLTDARLGVA
jgi:hypothetical protein